VEARPAPPPSAVAASAPATGRALEAFGSGALAVGGEGAGVGGGLGARLVPSERWGLHLGARARFGSIARAQSSSLELGAAAGAFVSLLSGAAHAPDLDLRLDALLLWESLTHFSADDPTPVRQARFLPGAATALELAWPRGAPTAFHLAAGIEVAAGRTDVVVHRVKVTDLSPWRAVAELGFRTRF
jgi:hypothetical protein